MSNPYLERWRGREAELEADERARAEYRSAAEQGDLSAMPVWASEAIDLITSIIPAGDLVDLLATEAERALTHASSRIT